jgi:hypothetical protein
MGEELLHGYILLLELLWMLSLPADDLAAVMTLVGFVISTLLRNIITK